MQILGQRRSHICQMIADLAAEELDRLQFKTALPLLVDIKSRLRCRAEGAMIEEGFAGVEKAEFVHGAASK